MYLSFFLSNDLLIGLSVIIGFDGRFGFFIFVKLIVMIRNLYLRFLVNFVILKFFILIGVLLVFFYKRLFFFLNLI